MKKLLKIIYMFILFIQIGYAQDTFQIPSFKSTETIETTIKKTMGSAKYKVTPGDVYQLLVNITNMVDKRNTDVTIAISVTDRYELEIPYLGNLKVKGMYYNDLRDLIIQKLKAQLSAHYVEFKLISPGIFDIFVYGSVKNPGFATATSLFRVSEILVQAGLLETGSYRNIQLIRNNQNKALDFLKYFTAGDLTQNPPLEPGDKIFVPFPQVICQVEGMVAKPGRYELLEGEKLLDLLTICGGIPPTGSLSDIVVTRIEAETDNQIYSIKYAEAEQFILKNGDVINIKSKLENRKTILLEGAVYGAPYKGTGIQTLPTVPIISNLPYFSGMTILSVLEATGGPTPFADLDNSMILRESSKEKIPVNIKQLWETKNIALDIELEAGDHIYIPMLQLKVIVAGNVNNPGDFPYKTESIVGDYLLLAGGVDPDKGAIDQIYKLDSVGRRTRLNLNDNVEPGTLIYVDKNGWLNTTNFLGQVGTIVSFSTAVVTFVTYLVQLINLLR